ncbi:putative tyrosine kinase receptor Cad96Ca-like, partial [Apostichopus japonicus]
MQSLCTFCIEPEETKDKKPLLRKQIQSGQPFEYWSACISTKDSHSYSCVAKKLSDQATIRDYESMKNLVQSLSLLDMGSGFVQILHSSIQTLPFAIYYEELNFGTLCDHVVSRFPTELLLNTNRKLEPTNHAPVLKYLLKFAEDIIKAMQYLAHQKFSHPALSLRKVLMTENGSCKLYSIYPNELCVGRIQQLLKKENPPMAWMATETFLLEKYFPESDIWNLSVFMWELLSIGEYPCAGLLQMVIKKEILEGFLLPRPKVCPKNL